MDIYLHILMSILLFYNLTNIHIDKYIYIFILYSILQDMINIENSIIYNVYK